MISMIPSSRGGNEIARTEISLTGSITIDARGMASFMVVLPTADDAITEEDETFTVTLSIPIGQITMLDPTATTVTTTIAANDRTPTGTWSISQAPTTPVNEDDTVTYTVSYDGASAAEEEQTVSILVTVGFTPNQAVAADIDGDTGMAELQDLTSARLATIIGTGAVAGTTLNVISATVTRTIDDMGDATFSLRFDNIYDEMAENAETFTVTLSGQTPSATMLPDPPGVTTTIAANDPLIGTWTIRQTAPTGPVNEGADARLYRPIYRYYCKFRTKCLDRGHGWISIQSSSGR